MDWRKSSFSGDGGNCVKVRQDLAALRDSEDAAGRALTVDLSRLLASVTSGALDR